MHDPIPITELAGGWRRGAAGSELNRRLRDWASAEPPLRPFATVDQLLRFLRSRPSPERDAVFCALLSQARRDPLAGQLVLEALLPGLKRLLRDLLVNADEREELWSLLFASVWEQIRTYPLARRPRRVAANLLLDAMGTATRTLARERRVRVEPIEPGRIDSLVQVDPGEDVEALLARAVAAAAISADEAELILATRIDGRHLHAVAAEQGLAYNTLKLRRQRAERRLLFYLGYPSVPRGQQKRPIWGARAAGAADAGPAGPDDLSRQPRR